MTGTSNGGWHASRNARGKTVVFVTHDTEEAVYVSDRVIVRTARLARIREEVVVDLPRPRDLAVRKSIRHASST